MADPTAAFVPVPRDLLNQVIVALITTPDRDLDRLLLADRLNSVAATSVPSSQEDTDER